MLGEYSTSGLFMAPTKASEARSSYLLGKEVLSDLRSELIHYHNCKDIILFNSGFWALVIALKAKLVHRKNNIVFMPSLTYRRLADAVFWAGGVPHFCDVSEENLALDRSSLIDQFKKLGPVGAIVVVQPIVGSVDIDDYVSIANNHSTPLIVDSVESVHDEINSKRCGSFCVPEVFSLHASKLINGYEGGYIAVGKGDNHYCYENIERALGSNNFSLNPVHAKIALDNLLLIDDFVEHNKKIYEAYLREFESKGLKKFGKIIEFPTERSGFKNIVMKLNLENKCADELVLHLNKKGIGARLHYEPALHKKNALYETAASLH